MSLSRSSKNEHVPKVEINIVPLVDVALVLLIIFMVTATFIKSAGVNIQLPTSSSAQAGGQQPKKEIIIGIDKDGSLLWEGTEISDAELTSVLQDHAKKFGTDGRVTVQGDERAAHGRVVQAMSIAQQAGFSHLMIAARREVRKAGNAL
ncbi:MAG: ExbD/TolR family protein [Armatimonadota bacterium]